MSKKMMLLALAVAALFALPASASALEDHISGVTTFTVEGGPGSLSASGEPTISCTKTGGTGSFDSGSTTTGKITLDFTGCTAEFLGATPSCKSSGEGVAAGTIATSPTFHVITIKNKVTIVEGKEVIDTYPAILTTVVTPLPTIVCAGFSNTTVSGNLIGTITSPACGGSTKEMKVKFTSAGATQEHVEYTGVKYDLLAKTGTSGANVTAGLNTTEAVTLKSSTTGTLECT